MALATASLDARMPAFSKAVIDFGTSAGQQTRDSGDLAARVAWLEEQMAKLLHRAA